MAVRITSDTLRWLPARWTSLRRQADRQAPGETASGLSALRLAHTHTPFQKEKTALPRRVLRAGNAV